MTRPARYATVDDEILTPRPEFAPAVDPNTRCCRCGRALLVAERIEYGGRCENCWSQTFKNYPANTDGIRVMTVEVG